MNPEEVIVKTGTFVYGETTEGTIQIVQTSWRPGSGDPEDPEEFREDQAGTFFRIDYRFMNSTPGGGYFNSLEEAIRSAESNCQNVKWSA